MKIFTVSALVSGGHQYSPQSISEPDNSGHHFSAHQQSDAQTLSLHSKCETLQYGFIPQLFDRWMYSTPSPNNLFLIRKRVSFVSSLILC